MTNSSAPAPVLHTIADVERDTGLSKDTLRVWERRYGFPTPERDALGERQYDDTQLLRLRHIRRLLDAGHRPGGVVALPLEQLLQLGTQASDERIQTPAAEPPAARLGKTRPRAAAQAAEAPRGVPVEHWMQLLRQHQAHELRQSMNQYLLAHGLAALIRDGVTAMNVRVGQSWLDGQLAVFEEHLYTETISVVLRQAIATLPPPPRSHGPKVLLTTVPGEVHTLGLLMAECFLALESCQTLPLGVQTPVMDIARAVQASGADVVALSFSAMQNPREARQSLELAQAAVLLASVDPAQRLAALLATMKDDNGRVTIPGYYDGIVLSGEVSSPSARDNALALAERVAEAVVEPHRDVAGDFDVLPLILSNRDLVCVVQQDVGSL